MGRPAFRNVQQFAASVGEGCVTERAPVFETIYKDYLARVSELDFQTIIPKLGIEGDGGAAIIPFYDKPYRVSRQRN